MHPVEDLDQRGLAGAVLAKQSVDLARDHIEIDTAQRLHAAEILGDSGGRKQRLLDGVRHGESSREMPGPREQTRRCRRYWPALSSIL